MDEEIALQIQTALDGFMTEVKAFNEETYKEIQAKLDAKSEDKNADPNSQAVQDLEKRLADRESEAKTLGENVTRLTKELDILNNQNNKMNGSSGKGVDNAFQGVFINNLENARKAVLDSGYDTVNKAIDSGLFVGDAGKLSIETADKFIDMIIEENATLSTATTRRMNGPTGAIDELRVGQRTLTLTNESGTPTPADSITLKRRTLTTVDMILAENITRTFLEDNIAKGNVEAHIASILAKSVGSQLNDLMISGDTTTGTFYVMNDGIIVLALADADVSDAVTTAAATAKEALNIVLRTMPFKFRAMPDLTYYINPVLAQEYADEFADRNTSAGDQVLINGFPAMRYFGHKIVVEPAMNQTTAGVLSDRSIIFTPSSNLVHGIQRNFTVDAEWKPRNQHVEYTMTIKNDYNYSTGEPFVLANDLPAAYRGA